MTHGVGETTQDAGVSRLRMQATQDMTQNAGFGKTTQNTGVRKTTQDAGVRQTIPDAGAKQTDGSGRRRH